MKKATLNKKLEKLGSEIIKADNVETLENVIIDIFPNCQELHVESMEDFYFLVCEDWEGAKPSKKAMQKLDPNFKSIYDISGLDVGVTKNKDGDLILYSSIYVEYYDKWEHSNGKSYTITEKIIS